MSIFQSSVLKKFLKQQDYAVVTKVYKKFTKYFHDPVIQQNIRDSKEEQFQAKFLDELFVQVLGYTLSPQPKFNLTTEFKNIKNSRKADGAILQDDKALAVIELKSTRTKDLESIRQQAFDYKANQPSCLYVITSNFEKIRFYINNAVDFEEFDLFNLSIERFELMYLCLQKNNLLKNIPLKIKEASILEEEAITKKFYADYSLFKRELYRDLVKRNMRNDVFRNVLASEDSVDRADKNIKLTLFKKSQKLLDRFLFIFFGEDRGLLPPNSIPKILEQWEKLKDMDAYSPLYERYQKYFSYLNEGWKGKEQEIFAYNGGLFKPDPILDSIKVDDELLFRHTSILTKYDFESQVDVNILGHIFENSLNEIESVNAEIEGTDFDKQKTKRKKDGVFYTPKYITKYIVDNTVGKLCAEKKVELKIVDEEFHPKRQTETKKKLLATIETYREWLLQLSILDPACGSGAFLNQALDFLIKEHEYIDELQAKLLGGGLVFPNIETTVLENNIYGVDLNEESVEIAKLSLWLRTAQPRRKLNDLSSNIKCGNSLIDSKSVAGDKAFKWEAEFAHVFEQGGFDVVIGNPPYGAKVPENQIAFLQNFSIGKSASETYAFFYERSLKLLNSQGILGFITPDTWLRKDDFKKLRNYLLGNYTINQIIETGPVFKDARDTWCLLIFIENKKCPETHKIHQLQIDRTVVSIDERQEIFEMQKWSSEEYFQQSKWINSEASVFGYLINENQQAIIGKLMKLNNLESNENYIISRGEEGSQSKFDQGVESDFFMVKPEQVSKFHTKPGWCIDPDLLAVGKLENLYSSPKIFVIRIQKMRWLQRIVASLDNRTCSASLKTLQIIVHKDKNINELLVLEAILNSTLINFWCINFLTDDINSSYLKKIPLPKSLDNIDLSEAMEATKGVIEQLVLTQTQFQTYVKSCFNLDKLSRKLSAWQELEFNEFIKELNKTLKATGGEKLSKVDEIEWMAVFDKQKTEANKLKNAIEIADKNINQMVYALYGLSKAEIELIENN